MESALDDLIARLDTMPEEQRVRTTEDAIAVTSDMPWIPNPGPQTEAYFSQADVLLYSGQAAGGEDRSPWRPGADPAQAVARGQDLFKTLQCSS